MFSLFKMETYRALRAKVVNVTLLILGLLSFFNVYISTMAEDFAGINICQQYMTVISNQMMLLIWAIMISVYISGEYKNGFVKSIAGQIPKRGNLAVSKLLLALLYTVEMFVVSFVFIVIGTLIFSGNNFVFGFSSDIILISFVQVILHVAFASIFILITTLTRSSAFGIGLGIFMGCGLTGMLYTGISNLINKIGFGQGFILGNYMLETNVQYIVPGIPSEFIVRSILVGIIFIAVTIFASVRILNKRDI